MREDIAKVLEELPKSAFGVALKVWFEEELEKLNDVSTIKGDVIEKGRILEGRQHAERLVKSMVKRLSIDKVQTPLNKGSEYK